MKYDCELIQDLIPLVKDGIASEKSRSAVSLHIKECPVCSEVYETVAQIAFPPLEESESMDISKVTYYKKRINKRRKVIISLAALFSVILVIGTVLATAFVIRLFAGQSYTTRNIADYGNYSGHIANEEEGLFSLLEIFPKEIPLSASVEDYFYFCNNGGLFDNSYQLYLVCSYGESDFTFEKERLTTIEIAYKNEIHKPIITSEGFGYQAVVTVFNDQNSFEYALIDYETSTIVYVFVQSMGIKESIVPPEHRPQGFQPPNDVLLPLGRYNIYQFKIGDNAYVIPEIDNVN